MPACTHARTSVPMLVQAHGSWGWWLVLASVPKVCMAYMHTRAYTEHACKARARARAHTSSTHAEHALKHAHIPSSTHAVLCTRTTHMPAWMHTLPYMHACMSACMVACVRARRQTCTHARTHARAYARTYPTLSRRTCAHMNEHKDAALACAHAH